MLLSEICRAASIGAPQGPDFDVAQYLNGRSNAAQAEYYAAMRDVQAKLASRAFSKLDVVLPISPGLSFAYPQQVLVADSVCPIVPGNVARTYVKWPRRDRNAIRDVTIGSDGEIRESPYNVQTITYKEASFGSKAKVDLNVVAQSPVGADIMDAASQIIVTDIMLARERRVANLFMTAGNYATSGNTAALSGNNRWDVAQATSTADPIKDINITARFALANTQPNTIIASSPVLQYLRQNRNVIALAGGKATDRVVDNADLARLFNVQNIIEAPARYDTQGSAANASYSFLWGKGLWIGTINPAMSTQQACFAKTIRHKMISYRENLLNGIGVGGMMELIATHEDAEVICQEDNGFLLDTVIS
jgi:hypothetical protein